MSFSKRVLFDRLPEDDRIRAGIARSAEATIEAFPVRALPRPKKPKRNLGGSPRDSIWAGALDAAVYELGVKCINLNGALRFRTVEDRDRVHDAAVLQWNSRWDEVENRRNQAARRIAAKPSLETNPKSSAPFILNPIPPDPRPSEDDLLQYRAGSSGVPELDRLSAELKWREARIEQDKDAFLVPFVNWIRPAIDYDAYLKTTVWKGIKNAVLDKAGRKCACCRRRATEVHHRDYRPRVLAGEDLSPLVPVCRLCHNLIEDERDISWQRGEAKLTQLVEAENRRLAAAGSYHQ